MNIAMKALSALAIVTAALTATANGPASAALVTLQGTYSFSQIADSCSKSGGNLASDGEGYACTKNNCDGKGGQCVVGCGNDGKCYGSTPDRSRGAGSFGKLRGPTQLNTLGTHPMPAAPRPITPIRQLAAEPPVTTPPGIFVRAPVTGTPRRTWRRVASPPKYRLPVAISKPVFHRPSHPIVMARMGRR